MTRFQKMIVIFCALMAMVVPPGLVAYIALSHNPQNEYMDAAGNINWELLSFVIAPSLVIGLVASGIVTLGMIIVVKLLNQHTSRDASKGP
ncbi:hypothetical protein [Pseudoduganella sp.]|uniref:hypothetical protein n=1 Tax=Pseudoduganella sp. TaxID=1880898 RepID=UPI0035AFC43A